jgi:cytochrome c
MKRIVLYGLVVILFLSVVQFNLSNAFAGKIDYKKIFKNECRKCHERDGKGTKRGKEIGSSGFY